MLPMWRFTPRGSRALWVYASGWNSGQCVPIVDKLSSRLAVSSSAVEKPDLQDRSSGRRECGMRSIEGAQGTFSEVSVAEARRALALAVEYNSEGPSVQGVQETDIQDQDPHAALNNNFDAYAPAFDGQNGRVSLNGCMQSNVPNTPGSTSVHLGYASYLNMPGGGNKLLDKYASHDTQRFHQSRHISTTTKTSVSIQGAQGLYPEDEFLDDPAPQGIQGDNCVRFKLWMENCQRYNLPNCDEQLQSIQLGRKTLAQVFMEQQEIIRRVAESYRNRALSETAGNQENAQGVQFSTYSFSQDSLRDVCPQGLQGDQGALYEIWEHNCRAFGFGNCDQKAADIRSGQRTLQDVFDEQDELIRKIVEDFKMQNSTSATSKNGSGNPEVGETVGSPNTSSSHASPPESQSQGSDPEGRGKLSQKDRLVGAVRDYGSTVIVFHIGISLVSLGGFYLAVSSGLDVIWLLQKLGVGESILQSRLVTGSTTFVMAYAVHKVFAPVRIATTLTCTPFIVRHLRKIGFLKTPKPKAS